MLRYKKRSFNKPRHFAYPFYIKQYEGSPKEARRSRNENVKKIYVNVEYTNLCGIVCNKKAPLSRGEYSISAIKHLRTFLKS